MLWWMTPRWSPEVSRAWAASRPWIVGCNFTPSTAVNQLEHWQADTFDAATIDRELGWAASLGFNTARVYLHDLLWSDSGFADRIDQHLEIAASHGISVLLVLFDDCWNDGARLGPQPAPHPGRHNSRSLQSPGLGVLERYPADRDRLERYVRGVIGRFGDDDRVLGWDLYNEPGGLSATAGQPVGAACVPLLADTFVWARDVDPSQPLTSGLFDTAGTADPRVRATQLSGSDVVSFHHYGPADDLEQLVAALESETGRALICSEYLARTEGSRFQTHLPIFIAHRVGALNWGLVSGRSQTIYPWTSWFDAEPQPEPDVWFHDILRPDGEPFDAAEVELFRSLLGP
jgi:hypothetical protein